MIKIIFSYILCLFEFKALAHSVNAAGSASEMDELVLEKAGFKNG